MVMNDSENLQFQTLIYLLIITKAFYFLTLNAFFMLYYHSGGAAWGECIYNNDGWVHLRTWFLSCMYNIIDLFYIYVCIYILNLFN